jgi:hypothetical protein
VWAWTRFLRFRTEANGPEGNDPSGFMLDGEFLDKQSLLATKEGPYTKYTDVDHGPIGNSENISQYFITPMRRTKCLDSSLFRNLFLLASARSSNL